MSYDFMAEEVSGEEERHDSRSELPSEVLSLIFSHLFLEQDHFIFGAICKSWKSVKAFRTHRPLPFDFSYVSIVSNYVLLGPT